MYHRRHYPKNERLKRKKVRHLLGIGSDEITLAKYRVITNHYPGMDGGNWGVNTGIPEGAYLMNQIPYYVVHINFKELTLDLENLVHDIRWGIRVLCALAEIIKESYYY